MWFMVILPLELGQCRQIYEYPAKYLKRQMEYCLVQPYVDNRWELFVVGVPCNKLIQFEPIECPALEQAEE